MLTRRLLLAGTAGSGLVAVSSWWVAGVPASFRHRDAPFATAGYWLGLALLAGAWLSAGRLLRDGALPSMRRVCLAWSAPMLLSMPMGRDLWSYAAQGRLVGLGLDPYRDSPAVLDPRYLGEVSGRWTHTPAPYGPVWLEISRVITAAAHPHVPVAAFLLRVPQFLAVAAMVWLVPVLARRAGGGADRALWLALANPLTIVLGLGGGHNDLLMLGLVVASAAVVTGAGATWWHLVAGSAVAGVAILVKFPAAIGLAFLVPLWLAGRRRRAWPDAVLAAVVAAGSGLLAAALATAASGLGTGWLHQAGADNTIRNWQSVPTLGAMLLNTLAHGPSHATDLTATMRVCRAVGAVAAAVLVVLLWQRAVRRPERRAVIGMLGAAFALVAFFAQTFQPWYLCWALPFVGIALGWGRLTTALAAFGIAEVLVTAPDGHGLEDRLVAFPAFALAAVTAWAVLGSAHPAQRDTDDAGAGVRTDGGAHLGRDHATD